MSYTGMGLLVGLQGTAGALGATSAPADPMDTAGIVPRECQGVAYYQLPPAEIAAGQVLVTVFPFVRKSADKMPEVLARILGNGSGGPVLKRYVEQNRGPTLQFVAGGWIRDTKSRPTTTKGYIWLALAPTNKRARTVLTRQAQELLGTAVHEQGLPINKIGPGAYPSTTNASGSTVDLAASWSAVASGESDNDLIDAVYRAIGGAAGFASLVRLWPSAGRAGAAAGSISDPFKRQSQLMRGAVNAVQGVGSLESLVKQRIDQALDMPSEQQQAAAQILNEVKAQVTEASNLIRNATAAAPQVIQQALTERERVLYATRKALLDSVEGDVQRSTPFEPAREYFRCVLLNKAKGMVVAKVSSLNQAITEGATAAQWLLNNSEAITDATKVLQALSDDIDAAFEQLPLGFWLRKRLGIPTWGWGVVGVGVFVGGAFGVRAIVKRSKT